MADTPGSGGSTDICWVSPSDQAGQINNILDRVHNLEVAVAQLAGLDVNATNLSDMVASLGTITNGTILLPDNSLTGWTNSIPPGDFSGTLISNGVITTWENGVVSFEVQPSGITTGGGGVSAAHYESTTFDTGITSSSGQDPLTLDSEAYDPDNIGSLSSNKITIAATGTYLINANIYIAASSGDFTAGHVYVGVTQTGLSNYNYVRFPTAVADVSSSTHVFLTPTLALTAGNQIGIRVFNNTASNIDAYVWALSIVKL